MDSVKVPNRLTQFFLIPVLIAAGLGSVAAQDWTQFAMSRDDGDGRFLWTETANWNRGLPNPKLSVEIGDDTSGKALHCVIPAGTQAVCNYFELAEHGGTQGTTLRLEKGAFLDVRGSAVLSKDRESWFYVDGTFTCLTDRRGIRVGGPWGRPDIGEPASCHLIIGPEGAVDGWFVGINTDYRAEAAPSTPWGENFYARSTGSEVVVNGGKLNARQGLRISTTDAKRPGVLRMKGKATFTGNPESLFGVDIWCGVWEIDGGEAIIRIGDLEMHGNKFKDAVNAKNGSAVGAGVSVLKLSGNGISTIRARKLNFVDAAVLDVSELKVPAGEYRVIDGESIEGDQLLLDPETDSDQWSLRFDRVAGDLFLRFSL